MSEARIADVIVPEVFTPYVLEKSLNQNRFFQSGVLTPLDTISNFLANGGNEFGPPRDS